MAQGQQKSKLHSLSKSERLCNFSLKKLLFEQGEQFSQYPLKIYWKLLDPNLEPLFFSQSPSTWEGSSVHARSVQNPSFPHQIVPSNALFAMPAQCLIGVSAKVHKKATQRNYLKRLLREAYRQNKHDFYSFLRGADCFCILGFIYTGKTQLPLIDIEKKILVSLLRIQQTIKANSTKCH